MFEKKLMIFPPSFFKTYSSWIILSVLLLAMGGIVWFGIKPLHQSLLDKARGIEEFYAGEENQQRQVSRLPELKDQYTNITDNEPLFNVLITEDQIVDFIKTLEGLANEMSVQMTITSRENGQIIESKKVPAKTDIVKSGDASAPADAAPAKAKASTNIIDDVPYPRYLHLNIRVEGNYSSIVAFLRKIETLPIGLDVVGVEVKKVDAAAQKENAPTAGTFNNPFALVGDGGISSGLQPVSIGAIKNVLEGNFEIVVYINKK
jgi:hypothetical protein